MPNRVIKESIWTSPNLNELSDLAERHFYRILPLPDDHGCCEITPLVVKGRCYPLKESVTVKKIDEWNRELEAADLIRTWNERGRIYAYFPTWSNHQRLRSTHQRKTPEPPKEVLERTSTSLDVNCRQPTSDDRLNPNPNPNPNPVVTPSGVPSQSLKKSETENFLDELRPKYPGVNLEAEIRKMEAWLLTPKGKGRKLTKGFIVNWLNKIDVPLEQHPRAGPPPPPPERPKVLDYQPPSDEDREEGLKFIKSITAGVAQKLTLHAGGG